MPRPRIRAAPTASWPSLSIAGSSWRRSMACFQHVELTPSKDEPVRSIRIASLPILLSLAALPVAAQQPVVPAELIAVRAGLDKYRDPIAAVYDGYLSTVACIE